MAFNRTPIVSLRGAAYGGTAEQALQQQQVRRSGPFDSFPNQ